MADPTVGTVIVRHIDELEAALRYAHDNIQPMLEKALVAVLDEKRVAFGWAGETVEDFDETQWLAPEEWRMSRDSGDNDFYLSFSLGTAPCIDGHEPETWVGIIAGFAGATIRFVFGTDALGQREWKSLLKLETALLEELVGKGFLCDPKSGNLALTIPIDRDALADGFEADDLETAFAPLGAALERIHVARPTFDRLVAAIKAKSR